MYTRIQTTGLTGVLATRAMSAIVATSARRNDRTVWELPDRCPHASSFRARHLDNRASVRSDIAPKSTFVGVRVLETVALLIAESSHR